MSDQAIRPRRSVLYMPGSNARALKKAEGLAADALILDLEDATAPDMKDQARSQVVKAVTSGKYGKRELAVRINGLDTPWGMADLKAAARAGAHAILVPKVNGPAMMLEIDKLMHEAGAPEATEIWAMMETPRGILQAQAIAASTARLTCMVMGTNDLAKELRAHHTPDRQPLITGLGLCLLAARAFDIAIIDGVYNDFKNEDGLRDACRQSLEMGFDGRTLIHPAQIGPCNEIFSPSKDALTLARKQIKAFAAAEKKGAAVAVVDGKIVENLHVEEARRLVAMDKAIKALAK